MTGRTLVAGVGNIFLGDDGFGVEVARRLAGTLPPGISVRDFGIRGIHLAYQLLEGFETLILVDALARGEAPGTLYVFEPDTDELPVPDAETFLDAHSLDPASVLAMVRLLGGKLGRAVVVGCEPGELGDGSGLSAPVERAVDEAVLLVQQLVASQPRGEENRTC